MTTALITGITGQVGSYLAEHLLNDDYTVYGIIRRSSSFNTQRIDHLYGNPKLKLIYGDLSDSSSLNSIIGDTKPDMCFHLAAQSHVRVSFDIPEYTGDATGLGTIRLLESIRKTSPKTRFYNAGTSVSGDTKVLVKLNDNIQLVEIEKLIEGQNEKTNYENLMCLTVDDDYQVKWSNVKYVFKHKSNNLYKVRGSGGLEITITGDHSVIVFNEQGNLIEKKVEDLTKNDQLISFKTKNTSQEYPVFNLEKYKNDYNKYTKITNIKLNKDLMRLIGFYLAEGSIYIKDNKNYKTTFTFHIKEKYYTEDIKEILLNNFNIKCIEQECSERNVRRVEVSNKQLACFLIEHFNTGSYEKTIPSWMYNIPFDGFLEFLRGYIGDAHITDNNVVYTSCNKNLIENICYLSKLNGLDCRISVRYNEDHLSPQNTIIKGCYCYDLIFTSEFADLIKNKFVDRNNFKSPNGNLLPSILFANDKSMPKNIFRKKNVSKNNVLKYSSANKLANSDLHIVRIKSIEKIDNEIDVYDLHVPETQRFIGGNYPVLLHNSELFGSTPPPQNELTPFHPRSPYGVAKLYGYWATINYRESYNMFCTNGIVFNTESPRRGETFVTRKITRALGKIYHGTQKEIYLGNLDAKRDWSHAKDSSRAMKMMLEHSSPDDFCIATGQAHSIRDFLQEAFKIVNLDYKDYVKFDPKYLRPAEVDFLCGDSTKARKVLGWEPEYTFQDLVTEMVHNDLLLARQEKSVQAIF